MNAMRQIIRYALTCVRCGHEWETREAELPKICPKCKRDWQTEKKRRGKADPLISS